MRIRATEALKDFQNEPMVSDNKPVTFRIAATGALNAFRPNETLSPEKKAKCFELAVKINSDDQVDITTEEAALILERAAVIYSPLTYGRLREVLNDEKVRSR